MESPLPMLGISPVAQLSPDGPDSTRLRDHSLPEPLSRLADPSIPLLSSFVFIVTHTGLPRISLSLLKSLSKVDEGGTFLVDKYDSGRLGYGLVAVKRTKFAISAGANTDVTLRRRLHSLLQEILVVRLPQLQSHENIINIFGWDWFEDWQNRETNRGLSPALIVEFAELGSLRHFLSTKATEPKKLLLCQQVASGLHALHISGIIHGDVKQENVLVCRNATTEFTAKISDFGNSLFEQSNGGSYNCTPQYRPPELNSPPNLISRLNFKVCDIYSYGLLVLEVLLDGQHYYEAQSPPTEGSEISESESGLDSRYMRMTGDEYDSGDEFDVDAMDRNDFLAKTTQNTRNKMVTLGLMTARLCDSITPETRNLFYAVFLQTLQEDPRMRTQSMSEVISILVSETDQNVTDESVVSKTPSNVESVLFSLQERALEIDMFLYDAMDTWKPDLQSRVVEHLRDTIDNKNNRGRNAFILSRMYSSGFGSTLSCPPNVEEGLKWLEESGGCGYESALLIGNRAFEANRLPVPEAFTKPSAILPILERLQTVNNEQYYIYLLREYLGYFKEQNFNIESNPALVDVADLSSIMKWIARDPSRIDSLDFQLTPNPQRPSQASLLHVASLAGDTKAVTYLIDAGANVNLPDSRNQTPLLLACMGGCDLVVSILLCNGADPTISDEIGATPYHWIFSFDDNRIGQIMSQLLERRAGRILNQSTFSYYPIETLCLSLQGTPLQWAIMARSVAAVTTLLTSGASMSPKLQDFRGLGQEFSPLDVSCGLLLYDIVPLFIPPSDRKTHDVLSPYFHLGRHLEPYQGWIIHGREYSSDAVIKTIRVLQLAAYDIEEPDNGILGHTPLMSAVLDDCAEVVYGLLKCGADVNARDPGGSTALYLVFEGQDSLNNQDQLDILKILVEAGADINALDNDGGTPLRNAILNECVETAITEFLNYGPDLSLRDRDGRTYLHYIATTEHLSQETMDRFIVEPDDVNIEDVEGFSPLCVAAMAFSKYMVNFFLSRRANVVFGNGKNILHLMIRAGTDRYGYDPLFFDFLLSDVRVNPCVHMTDGNGRTPLHEASLYAAPTHVKSLLRARAKWDSKDFDGNTPLMLAEASLQSLPDFVVPDHSVKEYYQKHQSLYVADVKDVIDILSSWEGRS